MPRICRFALLTLSAALSLLPIAHAQQVSSLHVTEALTAPGQPRVSFQLAGVPAEATVLVYEALPLPSEVARRLGARPDVRWVLDGKVRATPDRAGRAAAVRVQHPTRAARRGANRWEAPVAASALSGYSLLIEAISPEGSSSWLANAPAAPTALAASNPTLGSTVSITPSTVNTSAAAVDVVVEVQLLDTDGVASASFLLSEPTSGATVFGAPARVSGTAQNGIWRATVSVPRFSAPGAYALSVVASSTSGGFAFLETTRVLTVTGTGDRAAPRLDGTATITPASVDLSGGEATVTVTVPLSDAPAGVEYVSVSFEMGDETVFGGGATLASGTAERGVWTVEATIPQNTVPGVYDVVVYAADRAFNGGEVATGLTLQVGGGDTQAPTLVGTPTVTPSSVNLSRTGATVAVQMRVQDNDTGVASVQVRFEMGDEYLYPDTEATRTSGDALDGTYEVVFDVPRSTPEGVWTLVLDVEDEAGNVREIDTPAQLTIVGSDVTPPALTGPITRTPANLDLATGPKTVAVDLPLRDASGVRSVYARVHLGDDGPSYSEQALLASGDSLQGVWRALIEIPQNADDGTYTLSVSVEDREANYATLAPGLSVVVTGGDRAAPVLDGAAVFAPALLDLTPGAGTLVATLPLRDAGSGITNVSVQLTDANGDGVLYATAKKLNGTAQAGTWQATFTVPQKTAPGTYTLRVTARDAAFNQSTLSPPETVVLTIHLPGPPASPIPADGAVGVPEKPYLAWQPADAALQYDVYLWRNEGPQPSTPTFANVAAVQVAVRDTLVAGAVYAWRVVAKNGAGANTGPVWRFTVRQLADLRVVKVEAPATAESGQHVEVTWTVENAGGAGTSVPRWYDDLYLSTDDRFDPPRSGGAGQVGDVRVHRAENATALEAGRQYVNKATVLLPRRQFGQLYLIAVTNTGTGGEHQLEAADTNNVRATPIQLILPPAPDLEPTALIVPPTVFSGQKFDVRWTVENTGDGPTYNSAWDDAIYLTRDSVLVPDRALAKVFYRRILNIKPDSSYTYTYPMALPDSVAGTVYAHLVVDFRDYEFEPGGESNNTKRVRFDAVLTPPADLTATVVAAPAAAASGQPVTVSWTVENAGPGTTTTYWRDRLYLSPTPGFDTATATALETFYNVRSLAASDAYTQEKTVRLPDGVSGTQYLFAVADAENSVFEGTFETNNVSAGRALSVTLSPSADLVAVRADAPVLATAGQTIPVTWTIRNDGAATAQAARWQDSVFVSPSATWKRDAATYLGLAYAPDSLRAGATINRSASLTLPTALADGVYYVYVAVDAGQAVYEHQAEHNNVARSGQMRVSVYPAIDLAVASITAPAQAPVGTTVPVTYTVRNTGGATLARSWNDVVYLSEVDSLTNDARLIVSTPRAQPVANGESYTRTVSAKLPDESEPGTYYLLVHDAYPQDDANVRNNVRASAITLTPNPPPDLVVATATAPATLTAGQPVTLTWKVQNVGDGTTRDTLWYDNVWLARSADSRRDALRLGGGARTSALAPGGDYTATANVTIPLYASGSYYLLFETDTERRVYEGNREDNNAHVVPVEVVLPPPADLVVRDVRVPATATVGSDVVVTYKLENQGTNAAFGRMATGIYVSADAAWGVEDPLVYTVTDQQINLPPGGSMLVSHKVDLSASADSQRVTGPVPGVVPGRYHAIVRADLRNNIREVDDTNNLAVSAAQMQVDVPVLPLGTPVTKAYAFRKNHYYRVDVPAGLDLRLTLGRSAGRMPGGLYVAYGRVPTPSDYDFAAANASDEIHRLTVPTTQAGTYYVLVRAEFLYFQDEDFTLLAEALGFSVASISQRRLGQGVVTTRLTGAGFRATSTAVLKQGATVVAQAATLTVPSTTEMTVQWDLSAVPVGSYTLAVREGGAETPLADPVVVEPVVRPRLETVHAAPGALLAARQTEYVFQFRNTGNIDVPFGTILISAPAGTGLQVESDGRLKTLADLRHEAGDDADKPYWFDGQRERFLPMFVRRVAPGEPIEAQVTVVPVTPTEPVEFPVRVTVKVEDAQTFVTEQLRTIEEFRRTALTQQSSIDPQIAAMARNSRSFAQYMLDGYRRAGMLDQSEIDDALDRIPDILPRNSQMIEYGDIAKKTCDSIFFVTGCVAAILDCTPELAFIPLSAGASAAMCAFGVTAGCTPALDNASAATGTDLSLAGCIGIASALNCIAKEVVCNKLLLSLDPNDIVGPEGYGDARFVARSQTLPYTIRFENDAERATAPAQEIRITLPLDADLDLRTFRLGRFGFGLLRFDVPPNTAFYTTRLDARDSLGVYVDVSAGVDVQTQRAFWTLRAIDPATGALPANPYVGVLAINDSLGRGEGFVSYSIRPRPEARTGDVVEAKATIEFDLNAPIETPPWTNTVDAVAPTSKIAALENAPEEGRVSLSWTGADDAAGAGVATYTLYVSEGGEAFQPYATDLADTRFVYPGEPGIAYRFFVLATDHAGNTESVKSEPDVVVTRAETPAELPTTVVLEPNAPNPFSTTTAIRYALPSPATVTLEVYNVIGQRVAVLESEQLQPAGWHTSTFVADGLASGVYFYRLRAIGTGDGERWLQSGKMVLVR